MDIPTYATTGTTVLGSRRPSPRTIPQHPTASERTDEPARQPVARLEHVRFSYDRGASWALDDVDLTIRAGERICVIGPNGSGKSTLSKVLAGLIAPDQGDVVLLGSTVFDEDGAHPQAYRRARRGIGAVFQNPEDQIVTTVVEDDVAFGPENLAIAHAQIGERITQALEDVGMQRHAAANPIRMSGGQQQRIAIAGTLAMAPTMIVLDEPTAMLDTVARHEILQVLDRLQAKGTTIVHVTHLLDELDEADRIIRLEHGRVVADTGDSASNAEHGETATTPGRMATALFDEPRRSICPVPNPLWHTDTTQPAIEVDHVSKRYGHDGGTVIDDLSFTVNRGEALAIMGRNGSGKTTLARMLCALSKPDRGTIRVGGIDVMSRTKRDRKALRRTVGFIMQRPERQLFASTVARDIAYGPENQGLDAEQIKTRVDETMAMLNISGLADRSPFSLSGGQQRLVAIAGVLACRPSILVLDEPTASLDVNAKAGIHDLLGALRSRGMTIVLITHAEDEAHALCDRILRIAPQAHDPHTPATGAAPFAGGTSEHPSPVAALDPRIKLPAFLALMFTAFTITTPPQLLCAAVMVIAIAVAARTNIRRLFASIRGVLALFVMMGLLNIFFVRTGRILVALGPIPITTEGLTVAILYSCRLVMVIVLGAIVLDTTLPTALSDALGSLLSPLRHRMHTQELALVMSLALRFLPTLTMETRAIVDAQSARGGSIETGAPLQRLKALGAVLVPVFAGTLRHADNLSLALDARCYEEGINRTHWRLMRIRIQDIVFAALCVAYIVALPFVAQL